MQYLVVIEKGPRSWGAHVPDLPGCVAAAKTRAAVVKLIGEAIEFHIEGLKQAGEPVPRPRSEARLVDVAAA
jgi:predicted RNase H-like HicB family nuclease